MTLLYIVGGLALTLVMAAVTVAVWANNAEVERRMVESAEVSRSGTDAVERFDGWVRARRWGQRLSALLAGSGLQTWSPSVFLAATTGTALALGLLSLRLFGQVMAVLVMVVVAVVVRAWLERRRRQRVDRFVMQLPELARLLANGASAGLAVRRALELAADEMTEPAASEIRQVTSEMTLGRSLAQALAGLGERLPSRELSVLSQTLTIQGRAGGALVTALSSVGNTLEQRRQLRREIATATMGAQVSGYTVIFLGFGAMLLMNVFSPGIVDVMLTNLAGQVVLLVAGVLFTVGYFLVRRLARVEV